MTAIIIDDVPQAIDTLRADLADYCPDVELIGTADGVISGAKLLKEKTPDVLFLDIQMQDGTGFDLLEILPDLPFKIIFTTASDAFAIRAFKFSAIDYLLKPIDPEELMAAVEKLKADRSSNREKLDLLADHMRRDRSTKRIALHTQDKIHIVGVEDILRCEAMGNYTKFFLPEGRKLLVTRTLKEFDQLLTDFDFLRVHQSHLINFRQVREFVKSDGGYIVMKDGSKIPVSVRKRAGVMQRLEQL